MIDYLVCFLFLVNFIHLFWRVERVMKRQKMLIDRCEELEAELAKLKEVKK